MAVQPKVDTIDIIQNDPAFIKMCLEVMAQEPDIDEEYLVPIEEDEEDENGNPVVRERKGDYGDMVKYVPVKYIRERADLAFKRKYSFSIVAERREVDPFERRRYNRDEDDYENVDGDKYIRCIGMMIVPGLGVKMGYGVKKVRGGAESYDWKAAQTDAFKKCCEMFGIYLNYQATDDDDEEDSGSSRRSGSGKKSGGGKGGSANSLDELDLDDVEYDDDELEEAGDLEISFGKYSGYTLSEIMDEDEGYFCWLCLNARDDDVRESASIVAKAALDEQNSRSNRKSKTKTGKSSKSSSSRTSKSKTSRRKGSDDDDEEEEAPRRKTGKSKTSSADEKKRQKLIDVCDEAMEDYDKIARNTVIASVSVSQKYPKGKRNLEDLTIRELEELAEVLADEDEE